MFLHRRRFARYFTVFSIRQRRKHCKIPSKPPHFGENTVNYRAKSTFPNLKKFKNLKNLKKLKTRGPFPGRPASESNGRGAHMTVSGPKLASNVYICKACLLCKSCMLATFERFPRDNPALHRLDLKIGIFPKNPREKRHRRVAPSVNLMIGDV